MCAGRNVQLVEQPPYLSGRLAVRLDLLRDEAAHERILERFSLSPPRRGCPHAALSNGVLGPRNLLALRRNPIQDEEDR